MGLCDEPRRATYLPPSFRHRTEGYVLGSYTGNVSRPFCLLKSKSMANKNLESLAGSLFLVSILPFIAWVMNINKDDPKPAESPKFSETQAAIKSEPLIKPNTAECPFKSNEYCYVYINGSGMVSLDEAISDCEKR